MGGIQVFCFVASYSVALLLEVTRLWFKSGARGALMVGFAAAGLVAHTWFLVNEALLDPAVGAPLASWFDWYLAAAWALAVAYLYLTWSHPRTPVGLFLLPVILALIGVAYRFRDAPGFSRDTALTFWGWAHGVALLAGSVVVIGGFIAGATYLLHSALLKRKAAPATGLRLPSLEWLEAVNVRSLPLSAVLLGMGLLTGVILNLIKQQRQLDLIPWNDPVVWSTAILFGWLTAACVFSYFYRPARQGRKVAYLTVASLAFLLLVLVMTLYFTDHGGVETRNAVVIHRNQRGCLGLGRSEGSSIATQFWGIDRLPRNIVRSPSLALVAKVFSAAPAPGTQDLLRSPSVGGVA